MINLLPPQQKREILQEEKFKLNFILSVLMMFFLAVLCLLLFSIKIYTSNQTKNQEILIKKIEESSATSLTQNLEKEIASINGKFIQLNNFYAKQADFSAFLEKLSSDMPAGLYLINLSVSPQEKNKFNIALTGFAPSRQLLLEFKKKLDVDSDFSEINFPPSNWVKTENIDFSATFKAEL